MVYQHLFKVTMLPKTELTLDLAEEALKILMYFQENLLGTNFFGKVAGQESISSILSKTKGRNLNLWKQHWR